MKEFYPLLQKIKPRPALWTGETSLKSIKTFLDGYGEALKDYEIESINDRKINFHDWIARRFGFSESTAGWPNMILAVSIGGNPKCIIWENFGKNVTLKQHEESIKMFFELLEEYVGDG